MGRWDDKAKYHPIFLQASQNDDGCRQRTAKSPKHMIRPLHGGADRSSFHRDLRRSIRIRAPCKDVADEGARARLRTGTTKPPEANGRPKTLRAQGLPTLRDVIERFEDKQASAQVGGS